MKINLLLLLAILTLSACSIRKVVPEGSYLYTGAKVKVETVGDSISLGSMPSELKYAVYPKPNRKILGVRWRLRVYSFFYNKKQRGLFYNKRGRGIYYNIRQNVGEEPVIFNPQTPRQVEELLENRAFNNGYFQSTISSEVHKKEFFRRTLVKYKVEVEAPYLIQQIDYKLTQNGVGELIRKERRNTIIAIGKPYDLDDLKSERKRLTKKLRKEGYYYFTDDLLEFVADTSYSTRSIRLILTLKAKASPTALRPYRIGVIKVVPDYVLSFENKANKSDTLQYGDLTFLYDDLTVLPEIIDKAIIFERGQAYDPKKHETTLQRLSNLNTFKYVSVRFEPAPQDDKMLDVRIYLTPKTKRTIEGEIGVSLKSNLFLGPELKVNYINRNLFKGSETLRLSASGLFNFPLNDTLSYNDRFAFTAQFVKPNLWSPFKRWQFDEQTVGQTTSNLKLDRQRVTISLSTIDENLLAESPNIQAVRNRLMDEGIPLDQNFSTNQIELSYGYNWRKKAAIRHELRPINIGYQFSSFGAQEEEIIDEVIGDLALLTSTPELELVLEKMLFFQPDYVFLLDTRNKKIRRDNYLFRGRFSVAGNRIFEREEASITREKYESIYIQTEPDFRYLAIYNEQNQIATRIAAGVTIPFNEDVILPFFSLYSIGGANSVRAFAPRTIGPGSRPPGERFVLPYLGVGDIKLEGNIEYRWKVTSMFELATFVDAGNVWRFNNIETRGYDSTFKFNRFYKQFAIGTGLGLRVDLGFLLLRFDLATPVTKPWRTEGQRLAIDEFALGRKDWRRENLVLNFAFGYPF